jgi:hypothetical protein
LTGFLSVRSLSNFGSTPNLSGTLRKEIVMIRKSMTIMFALLLTITTGTVVGAEMAKEGSGDYRSGKTGTFVVLPMEKERLQMNYEAIGVVVKAPENSPLHNASFRNIGTLHAIKGKWKGSGFVEWTRPNGDKVYATFEGEGVLGGRGSSSVGKFVGGTGTCAGIEGTIEIKGTPGIKSSKKGTYSGISVGKFNWKIP